MSDKDLKQQEVGGAHAAEGADVLGGDPYGRLSAATDEERFTEAVAVIWGEMYGPEGEVLHVTARADSPGAAVSRFMEMARILGEWGYSMTPPRREAPSPEPENNATERAPRPVASSRRRGQRAGEARRAHEGGDEVVERVAVMQVKFTKTNRPYLLVETEQGKTASAWAEVANKYVNLNSMDAGYQYGPPEDTPFVLLARAGKYWNVKAFLTAEEAAKQGYSG